MRKPEITYIVVKSVFMDRQERTKRSVARHLAADSGVLCKSIIVFSLVIICCKNHETYPDITSQILQ